MENKKHVTNIDFADSDIISYEMNLYKDELYIYFNSWDDKTIKITFLEPERFLYKLGGVMSDFYEILEETQFLKDALSVIYDGNEIPKDHPYKLFQLINIDDWPFIEVVAKSATVIKYERNNNEKNN